MWKRILRELVKATPIWTTIHPRRFQAYCVGAPKSGTVSVWGMFSTHWRAAHEAARPVIVRLMNSRILGEERPGEVLKCLTKRDRDLRLEMDSFSLLALFSGELAQLFPDARFLLTFREPRRWLNSIMNQHLNVDVSERPADRLARHLLYGQSGARYSEGEEELERRGLFPIGGYLKGWCTHYKWVIDNVPPERLLVIRTDALRSSIPRISRFLGLPVGTIDRDRVHLHKAPRDHRMLETMPEELIDEMVAMHCAEMISHLKHLEEGGHRNRELETEHG